MSTVGITVPKWLTVLFIVGFLSAVSVADVGPNWIEQWGIRWTFDRNISLNGASGTYRYGQFANGDYWVVGPVNIIAITPPSRASVAGDKDESGRDFPVGTIVNGSMINPPHNTAHVHGYTSGASVGWMPDLNVAWGVNAQNPLAVAAHSSLISTVSRNDPGSANRSSVQRGAILTVLPSGAFDHLPAGVSPEDCFRPAYIGTTKIVRHWKQQLDYSFLQQLSPVGSGIPSLSEMEDQFKRPWIRKAIGWTSRFIHPLESMPDYYMVLATNNGALVLNMNYTNQQKETLLVNYSQLGIDLYGPYEAGSRGNGPDGGIFPGLLLPMLVAGRALNYSPMLDICQKSGDYINSPKPGGGQYGPGDIPPDYLYIQELCQTFYVTQREIEITQRNHSIPWTPSGISFNWDGWDINGGSYVLGTPYTTQDIGLPDYGIRHSTSPGWTTKHWDVYKNYRGQNSPYFTQTAFLMLAMGMKDKVNHSAFFDYTDRWAASRGQSAMRAAYRQNYGPVWPDNQGAPATYTLSISASGGTVTRSPNKTAYTPGETVTLTAAANTGYTFANWSGSATGTTNPVTITMDGNKSVTANFSPNGYTLAINATNGSVVRSPSKAAYTHGETVTLTAAANTGYTFAGWSGSATGTTNPVTITMDGNKSVTANFSPNSYTLTINAANGSVVRSPSKAAYTHGETVTLTAAANTGYTFANWSGSATGTTNPVTITMNGNKSVTANFSLNGYTLAINAANGSVVRSPSKAAYTHGETVTLTAAANTGFTFANWSGGDVAVPTQIYQTSTAMTFNGIDQYESVSTDGWRLDGTTVALWARPERVSGSYYLLGHTVGSWSNRIQLYIRDGQLGLGLGNTHALRQEITPIEAGQWYFIALTFGNGTYNVYVNGELAAAGSYDGLTELNTFVDIGNTGNAGFRDQEAFHGIIEDVRIFTAVLESSRIQTLAAYGRNGIESITDNPISITMDGDKTITAAFEPIAVVPTYTVTFNLDGKAIRTGGGALTQTVSHGGSAAAPTVTANAGWNFTGWDNSFNNVTGDLAITANYAAVLINLDPVAHWLFDHPYQPSVFDIVSGQAAALINAPEWGQGWAEDYFVRLDNGRQAVQIPMNACSHEVGTIAMWAKPENSTTVQFLFGHSVADTRNRIALYWLSGDLAVGIGDVFQTGIMPLIPGQSYHIALTWNSTNYAVYVDGIPKHAGAFSGLTPLSAFADAGNTGNPDSRENGLGFRGLIEDVQLYSRALSADEIESLVLTNYVKENRSIEFVVSGMDELGNPLSYTASDLPDGAFFDTATQSFMWRPALYNSAGCYDIRFSAAGQSDQTVTVSVQDVILSDWYAGFLAHIGKH